MKTSLVTLAVLLAGATPAHAAVTLSSGHADYGARIVGGKLQSQIKIGSTWRDPSAVVAAQRDRRHGAYLRSRRSSRALASPPFGGPAGAGVDGPRTWTSGSS